MKVKRGNREENVYSMPEINEFSSSIELILYFKWCADIVGSKKLTREFFSAFPELDKNQYVESSILAITYGISEGLNFPSDMLGRYHAKMKNLKEVVEDTTSTVPDANIKKFNEKHNNIIGHIEDMTDKQQDFDIVTYAKDENLDVHTCNIIEQHFRKFIDEYTHARNMTDDQCVEAYAHFGRDKLNSMIKYYESLITNLDAYRDIKKSTRKPRKKKKKTPEMILKHFTCMEEYEGFTSIDPKKILDSTYLWVFDTKYKKLTVFIAKEGETLGVYRTAITNFDENKSICKRIGRKEKEVLDSLNQSTQARKIKIIEAIKTAKTKIPERINTNVILLHTGKQNDRK